MKLGIALAGGGVKGAAHLGMLQAFEEAGIKADMYAGTSAGSIVATLKALGKTNEEILVMLHKLDTKMMDVAYIDILLSLPNKLRSLDAILKGNKLRDFLVNVSEGKSISDAQLPLSILSTDINSGCQVVFSTEDMPQERFNRLDNNIKLVKQSRLPLSQMMYSSCALPGIFRPVVYENMKLVDGSLTNNLPANVLKVMGADKVIGIDLAVRNRQRETKGMFDIVGQSINILIEQTIDLSLKKAEDTIYLNPEITDIGLLDFKKAVDCYNRGYVYAKDIIPYVLEKLEESN